MKKENIDHKIMLEHNFVMIGFDRIDREIIRVYFYNKHKNISMAETIDEQVSVNLLFNHLKRSSAPTSLYWRGRRYTITQIGLHHIVREGRTLLHIFSVTDGTAAFKLELNAETLSWKLLEIEGAL